MTLFSSRLPHVMTRADLADLLAPTYAREVGVSEELAQERLARALKKQALLDRIYDAVSTALVAAQGSRKDDTLMNQLSKAVPKRRDDIKAAPTSPALAAVTVWINIDLGLAPDMMRATLESDKGRKLLDQGFAALGEFLVKQLVR